MHSRCTLERASAIFPHAVDNIQGHNVLIVTWDLRGACPAKSPHALAALLLVWLLSKVPLLLDRVRHALEEGSSVVIGLTTTGEAYAEGSVSSAPTLRSFHVSLVSTWPS